MSKKFPTKFPDFISRHDRSLCLVNVPRFATCVSDLLLSEKLEVLNGSALALKVVVLECLGEPIEDAVLPILGRTVSQLLSCLQACLKFQYHVAWKYVIHVLAALYQVQK